MKKLKFAVLVLTVLMANSSCTDKGKGEGEGEIPPGLATQEEIIEGLETFDDGGVFVFGYMLWFSFQDTFGNDLVEKSVFEVRDSETGETIDFTLVAFDATPPEFYTLDIIFEEGIPNPWNPESNPELNPYTIYHVRYPKFYFSSNGWWDEELNNSEYNYLMFQTHSPRNTNIAFAKKILLRFTCPSIFGDDGAHDIVTWWEQYPPGGISVKLSRVEYDGKECLLEGGEESHPVATIILDR